MLETDSLSEFGTPVSKFVERLLDLCGYPVSNDSSVTTLQMYKYMRDKTPSGQPKPVFNMFRLLAYQRIFFDYYRNTDYTANNPRAYNVDNLAGGQGPDTAQFYDMFYPRYAMWHKDRITSVKPSPLAFMQTASTVGSSNGEGLTDSNVYLGRYSSNTSYAVGVSDNSVNLNISRLRATMAYDRLARLTMLSPKTYEAQLKAQFGVTPGVS